ncbi:replication-relaxation family protein (plasmid) [Paenibacillus urinalis]|uniref:Replication-relaxation family protein n=1 Tax=Paenibacillus urinalis TaxID=521520 RepID=A0AAX3N9F9_9BACL|nr:MULTISPECIES: replication-relaxation family protein [Paenibacillus]MCM3130509.1 replication-relaxation family protein [Paenibacillus sp. MER 78]WDH85395.1 replication-relaxation family protein [Paenibacillus urinalis]WDH95166.1 replication-relaxation family protein [Paenibacillus urinalis]WDI05361.1 replication-relaxation family protein [Paenibacillus urinalis]
MEFQVSPLLDSAEEPTLQPKPIWDDPYAYVTGMDQLTRHEFYYIEEKIKNGWITDRDIEIVRFLFVHRWITLSQLQRIFFPEAEREETVKKRVRKLLKYGMIRRIQWKTYSSPSENRQSFYELGASGADVLKYRYGLVLGNRDPRATRPMTMLYRMKYSVTNELYIQLRENFKMTHFEFHPILKIEEEQQIPMARYILRTPKGKMLSFYLVVHREDEKWLKTLRYQAQFYKNFLKSTEGGGILILLLSTEEKATLAQKLIMQEGISDYVWFLTDNDLYNHQKNLKTSFFIFQNEEKQYYNLS